MTYLMLVDKEIKNDRKDYQYCLIKNNLIFFSLTKNR